MDETPMTMARFLLPAGDGNRFAPRAFDHILGTLVPLRVGDRTIDTRVLAVEVVMDGQYADFTIGADAADWDGVDTAVSVALPPISQPIQLSVTMKPPDGPDLR